MTTLGTTQVGALQLGVLSEPPEDAPEPEPLITRALAELLEVDAELTVLEDTSPEDAFPDAEPPLPVVGDGLLVEAAPLDG